MKTKPENKTAEKWLAWTGVISAAVLAAGICLYVQTQNKINLGERESRLTDKLLEVAQLNSLIRDINGGRTNAANELLNSKLASDLATVDPLTPPESHEKAFADLVVGTIAKDEKAHPDYYLASVHLRKAANTEPVQTLRH